MRHGKWPPIKVWATLAGLGVSCLSIAVNGPTNDPQVRPAWISLKAERYPRPPIIGCCGWQGAQDRYFEQFHAIEIQSTFYQPPATNVALRWKAKAPSAFQFSIKAWQLITHTPSSPTYRKLKTPVSTEEQDLYGSFRDTEQVMLAWERTEEIARVLDAQVIVFQCPRSFLPTRENIRNMARFFTSIDHAHRLLVWEPRGEDWTPSVVRDVCEANQLVHCVDPFDSDPVTLDALYWRLHGRGGYRYRYTEDDLAQLHAKLASRSHLAGARYIMFNNMSAGVDASRFKALECPSPRL